MKLLSCDGRGVNLELSSRKHGDTHDIGLYKFHGYTTLGRIVCCIIYG